MSSKSKALSGPCTFCMARRGPPSYTRGAMLTVFKQLIEIIFTSYLLPALLLPLIWLARAAMQRRTTFSHPDAPHSLRRLFAAYAATAGFLLLAWVLSRLGVPIEHGGRPLTVLVWLVFGALNFIFAGLATSVTSNYGALANAQTKDSIFLRFLAIILIQPFSTAAAFSVLYRLLRLVYKQVFPWLDVSQEGF